MSSFHVVFARQRESPGTDKGEDSAKKTMRKTNDTHTHINTKRQKLKDKHKKTNTESKVKTKDGR
jgi:hypothetical protein